VWPSDDLNLVRVTRRAAPKQCVERVTLNGPVGSVRDRQHLARDELGWHTACPPLCAREQRLIGFTFGTGNRFGLKCSALHIFPAVTI
jgi:hypothetical protein